MKKPASDIYSLRKLQGKRAALQSAETFPYSENLKSVMVTDLLTCSPGERADEVVKRMVKRKVTSALITDDGGDLIGIMTEGDVMKRIVALGVNSEVRVKDVMSAHPVALGPDDSVYRAMSALSVKGVKHLPLVEDGKPVGVVTLRQLLKLRYPEPMTFVESIWRASEIAELKEVRAGLPELAARKLSMGVMAHDIVTMLSLLNQDIHRRAFEIAIERLGGPPSGCCLFLTGSHGRMENLLQTDQDHGMIIADSPDGEGQHNEYFMELTENFSRWLVEIGYPWCPGYVMSINPTWRKSLSEWKVQIRYWLEAQVLNLARFITVLFDSVPIYGDIRLFEELMDNAYEEIGRHHEIYRILHEEEGGHQVPTGFLGRFITERNGPHKGLLDIKKSGLIFVVEGVRILALQHGIRETSTLKRIDALVDGGFIHPDDGEYFEASYRLLLHIALNAQVESHLEGRPINTYIDPKRLSPRERDVLRRSFKSVTMLKDFIAGELGELVL
jgi:CBS domain-containing protein